MAAATVASTSRPHIGELKRVFRSYTALADTNTDVWPTGTNIVGVNIVLASTSASVTASVSGSTITYHVSAGNPDVTVEIILGQS